MKDMPRQSSFLVNESFLLSSQTLFIFNPKIIVSLPFLLRKSSQLSFLVLNSLSVILGLWFLWSHSCLISPDFALPVNNTTPGCPMIVEATLPVPWLLVSYGQRGNCGRSPSQKVSEIDLHFLLGCPFANDDLRYCFASTLPMSNVIKWLVTTGNDPPECTLLSPNPLFPHRVISSLHGNVSHPSSIIIISIILLLHPHRSTWNIMAKNQYWQFRKSSLPRSRPYFTLPSTLSLSKSDTSNTYHVFSSFLFISELISPCKLQWIRWQFYVAAILSSYSHY